MKKIKKLFQKALISFKKPINILFAAVLLFTVVSCSPNEVVDIQNNSASNKTLNAANKSMSLPGSP
ncbi:MAG TPA: hypothetical protein VKN14_01585, partial [Flavobacteriaceae bacterium]|nr:hypothetical protein [Flavobacteriaceae bacterium]